MLLHDIILRKIIFSVTKWENLHVNTVLITRVFDPEYVKISYLSLVHQKFSTLLSQDEWFVFIPKLCAQ